MMMNILLSEGCPVAETTPLFSSIVPALSLDVATKVSHFPFLSLVWSGMNAWSWLHEIRQARRGTRTRKTTKHQSWHLSQFLGSTHLISGMPLSHSQKQRNWGSTIQEGKLGWVLCGCWGVGYEVLWVLGSKDCSGFSDYVWNWSHLDPREKARTDQYSLLIVSKSASPPICQ